MARKPSGVSVSTPTPASNRQRLEQMADVAKSFRAFRPAPEVVRRIESVPSLFVDLDRVFGVGGIPTSRVLVVHGPSNKGKTALSLGMGLSFLRRDHFFGLVDLEQTTPEDWLRDLYGEAFEHPGFAALPTGNFEQVRAGVRDFFETIAKARDAGKLSPDTRALVLVDSVKKLMPAKLWDALQKSMAEALKGAEAAEERDAQGRRKGGSKQRKTGGGGVDGASGMGGMIKAQFITAWLDELVPLLAATQGTILLIAREKVIEATNMYEKDIIELGGGEGINYDASLRLRIDAKPVYVGEGESRVFVGERHTVDILKTKIHGKQEQVPRGVFHTSNGVECPAGFNRARDLLVCGLELGVIEQRGAYFSTTKVKLGQGVDQTLKSLLDEQCARQVEEQCRAAMASPKT
jgi:hypothetical protein